MTATTSPAVLDSDQLASLDSFATPTTVKVKAKNLRERMVLVDPVLGTPYYWIDHRVRSTSGSGNATFMAHNLETGRFETVSFFGNTRVPVMAR